MRFPSHLRRVSKSSAATLAVLFAVLGCASLPSLDPVQNALAQSNPTPSATSAVSQRKGDRAVAALVIRAGDTLLERHIANTERLLDAPITGGNAARLLIDGPQTHAAMFAAIAAARDHIHLVSYIIEDDEIGAHLARALAEKRRAGVRVRVMYDSVGSMSTPREFFNRLRADDIAVCEFNPVNPSRLRRAWKINNRDHRKVLIVDGRIGFSGGINMSSVYSSGSFVRGPARSAEQAPWRDTHIEVRGPAVADLQRNFIDSWRAQKCPELVEDPNAFPKLADVGQRAVRILTSSPSKELPVLYVALLSAFQEAQKSITVTSAYFVPDPLLMEALTGAARRGVAVRLMLPSFSDFWAPLAAGRSHYTELLAAGVRIYERKDALLHAKTACVDGVWSTIGSTNLDWRSFIHNEEANVVVFDDAFGAELNKLFERDVQRAVEITSDAWAERGIAPRLREWLARRFEYFL
jgi:cardiolipin synthase A/B